MARDEERHHLHAGNATTAAIESERRNRSIREQRHQMALIAPISAAQAIEVQRSRFTFASAPHAA
jgi:hypothetical protein